jgi:hypothetical protein
MTFEIIGLITAVAGILCVMLGMSAVAGAFAFTLLLGASATTIVGGANIQPAHLFLVFVSLAVLSRRMEAGAALRSISPPLPGFWLLCLVIYGIAGSFTLPRLLAGSTFILPLGASQYADTGSTVPLGPVSSNLTQSIYFASDLICFCLTAAIASTREGFEALTKGLLTYCAGNVVFALLDVATYATGTEYVLSFMRNARYVLHHQEEIGGLKRIVGSFTEASVFARSTLGALGFTGTLWLCAYRPWLTGPLAAASLVLVVLSTSSAGLVALGPVLVLLYVTALRTCGTGVRSRNSAAVVLFAPPVFVALVLGVLLNARAAAILQTQADTLLFNKSATASGLERASWNAAALQNVFDTWGVGVGLGTARASNFALALLSNLGVLGALCYGFFLTTIMMVRLDCPNKLDGDVRLAALNAGIGLIIADLMIGTTVDQGLLFYVLMGLCSARPLHFDRRPAPRRGISQQLEMQP